MDMKGMPLRFASFFAGIGGFDLGFQRAGMTPVFHCEIDHHCQIILRRHWPEVPLHEDITTLKSKKIPTADVWAAGWPCQDLSSANPGRKGLNGKYSSLFYYLTGLAGKVRPRWLILENVIGVLSAEGGLALESVVNTLEEIGYMGGWFACNTLDFGLPHNRARVFFVATYRSDSAIQFFADSGQCQWDSSPGETLGKTARPDFREVFEGDDTVLVQRRGGFGYTKAKNICPTIRAQTGGHQGGHSDRPIVCRQTLNLERMREANGVSGRMDGRRGRLIGNAVSPIITEWIAKQIIAIEKATS